MDKNQIRSALKNYTALIKRVNDLVRHIEKKHTGKIACKKGCDACCKRLTLFPVEAAAVSDAYNRLPETRREKIKSRLEDPTDTCPLLIDRACALYPARPVICRTHGYPIYMEKNGKALIDFCPENFKGVTSFSKDDMISIEQLNTTLNAVNQHFLESIEPGQPILDRISIADALFLLDSKN